jgi:hypothetical protein
MCRSDVIASLQIRNRPTDLQNSIISSRRQTLPNHRLFQQLFARGIDLAMLSNHTEASFLHSRKSSHPGNV